MDGVLKDWSALYKSFLDAHPGQKINDQPFFRAVVYGSSARAATLTCEYNCKFRGQGYLNGRVKILYREGVRTETGRPHSGSPEGWLRWTLSAAPGTGRRGWRETVATNVEGTRGAVDVSEVDGAESAKREAWGLKGPFHPKISP
jgi:hypothetical protein